MHPDWQTKTEIKLTWKHKTTWGHAQPWLPILEQKVWICFLYEMLINETGHSVCLSLKRLCYWTAKNSQRSRVWFTGRISERYIFVYTVPPEPSLFSVQISRISIVTMICSSFICCPKSDYFCFGLMTVTCNCRCVQVVQSAEGCSCQESCRKETDVLSSMLINLCASVQCDNTKIYVGMIQISFTIRNIETRHQAIQ